MAKIIMVEKPTDLLLESFGKAKVVEDYGAGDSRIVPNNLSSLKVTFKERNLTDNGILLSEKTLLQLEANGPQNNFRAMVESVIPVGKEFTDHFVKFNEIKKTSEIETENLNASIASYDVITHYNYYAKDYDTLQVTIPETSLLPITKTYSKEDYINFKNQRKTAPVDLSPDSVRYRNFVIPNVGAEERKDLNSSNVGEQFPYYNEIKINNKVTNRFTDFITNVEIFDQILTAYLKSPKTLLDFNIQEGTNVKSQQIEAFPLLSWVNSDDYSIKTNFLPLLSSYSHTSKMSSKFKKLLLAGYIRNISLSNFRSFEQIVNNDQCYIEDFVYQIDKYKDVVAEPKTQSFFIPAVNDNSILNDTQVKYGNKYIYKCKAHYIIVGNRYSYDNIKYFKFKDDRDYATVEVTNTPSVVIVPFDMFTEAAMSLQPPPIFPQVNFVTQNNSTNKIQIYLSPTKGQLENPFVPIEPKDIKQSEEMKLNSITTVSQETRFQFSNQPGLYEIFKTDVAPQNYEDFENKKISNVRMPFTSNSAIYNDVVLPNKKYYYLFRKINAKGLVSNPTPIYEVELLKDADESKIMVTKYKFPEIIKKQDSKKFKSLFQIYPSQDQTWFDNQQAILWDSSSLRNTVNNLSLGVAKNSVWGRKFKIRIKSTTSGKIIDYNVTFKLTKNKTEEDF